MNFYFFNKIIFPNIIIPYACEVNRITVPKQC